MEKREEGKVAGRRNEGERREGGRKDGWEKRFKEVRAGLMKDELRK